MATRCWLYALCVRGKVVKTCGLGEGLTVMASGGGLDHDMKEGSEGARERGRDAWTDESVGLHTRA